MLCDDYKRVVYFFLDGSVSQRKAAELETHRRDCHDCDERTLVHRKLRAFVKKRLAPLSAPEHLKVRLVASLRVGD